MSHTSCHLNPTPPCPLPTPQGALARALPAEAAAAAPAPAAGDAATSLAPAPAPALGLTLDDGAALLSADECGGFIGSCYASCVNVPGWEDNEKWQQACDQRCVRAFESMCVSK